MSVYPEIRLVCPDCGNESTAVSAEFPHYCMVCRQTDDRLVQLRARPQDKYLARAPDEFLQRKDDEIAALRARVTYLEDQYEAAQAAYARLADRLATFVRSTS